MQQGADLVAAGYPVTNPHVSLLGATSQSQSNLGARSNIQWFGIGNLTDGALAATGVAASVAIPVAAGDTISKISILAGATAEATGAHAWAALYSGIPVPALLGQSADNTGAAAVAASARFDFALQTAVTLTNAQAPYGFVYASIMVAGTTIPTAASISTPTAVGYQWFSNGPLFFAATHGSGLTTTAPATIASPSAKAVAPVVILS